MELPLIEAKVVSRWFPTEIEGQWHDRRFYYFRSRGAFWALGVGATMQAAVEAYDESPLVEGKVPGWGTRASLIDQAHAVMMVHAILLALYPTEG